MQQLCMCVWEGGAQWLHSQQSVPWAPACPFAHAPMHPCAPMRPCIHAPTRPSAPMHYALMRQCIHAITRPCIHVPTRPYAHASVRPYIHAPTRPDASMLIHVHASMCPHAHAFMAHVPMRSCAPVRMHHATSRPHANAPEHEKNPPSIFQAHRRACRRMHAHVWAFIFTLLFLLPFSHMLLFILSDVPLSATPHAEVQKAFSIQCTSPSPPQLTCVDLDLVQVLLAAEAQRPRVEGDDREAEHLALKHDVAEDEAAFKAAHRAAAAVGLRHMRACSWTHSVRLLVKLQSKSRVRLQSWPLGESVNSADDGRSWP
eukprot:323370-Chlamydomonas_euryale.AAC.4